jgi:hypothetical protein
LFYKLGKKFFKFVVNILHVVQIFLIFLSFFIILYWILQIAGMQFDDLFTLVFENIKNFTHLFYNRITTIGGASVDFSFLVATLSFLLIVWAINFMLQYIKLIEENYEKTHERLRQKNENTFNAELKREYIMQEYKNNKFLLMINFNLIDKHDKFFTGDDFSKTKEKELLFDFFEIIDEDIECRKETVNNGILLYFDDFNSVDKSIYNIEKIIEELKIKYFSEQYFIDFYISADVYAKSNELEQKIKLLLSLIKLGLKNKIICPSTFKERYSLVKNPKYTIKQESNYQILGENRDLFCIKNLK